MPIVYEEPRLLLSFPTSKFHQSEMEDDASYMLNQENVFSLKFITNIMKMKRDEKETYIRHVDLSQ